VKDKLAGPKRMPADSVPQSCWQRPSGDQAPAPTGGF